ncbi:MAG: tetratricopeptide repeat protein [Planctomycetota bacterium]
MIGRRSNWWLRIWSGGLLASLTLVSQTVRAQGENADTFAALLERGEAERVIELLAPRVRNLDVSQANTYREFVGVLLAAYRDSVRCREGVELLESLAARGAPLGAVEFAAATEVFSECGRLARFGELLDAAIADAPEDVELRVERARLRHSLGRHEAALEDLARARAHGHSNARTLYLEGLCRQELGDVNAAELALRAALAADAGHALVEFELGRLLLRDGRARAALPLLKDSFIQQPRSPATLFNLQLALDRNGASEEALRVRAAFAKLSAQAEREKDLVQAVRVNSGEPRTIAELAEFFLEVGRPSKALPLAQRVFRSDPQNVHLRVLRARALLASGRVADAELALRAALELDSDQPQLKLWLAELAARDSRLAEADAWLGACRGQVDEARVLLLDGELAARRQRGFEAAAEPIMKAIVGSTSESPATRLEAILALVDLAVAFHRQPQIDAWLTAAAAREPKQPEYELGRGVLALESSDFAHARARFDASRRIDPWLSATYRFFAQLEERVGNTDVAREHRLQASYLRALAGS